MKKTVITLICLVWFGCTGARAQETQGRLIVESKYFSVYGESGMDAYSLLARLDFDYLLFGQPASGASEDSLKTILADSIDGLYQEVSDIMDIHIYNFHGTIRLLPDQQSLSAMFRRIFNTDFNERAVYYHEKNTIYASYPDISVTVLGHEMSHAIMSHFFVVPPPSTIQEVLAGFVEYQLRKKRGTLPRGAAPGAKP